MSKTDHVILIPDSGPLLELHRANKLGSLFVPFASLAVPDAVVHELLRNTQEEGKAIAVWISTNNIPIFDTRTFANGQRKELTDNKLPQGVVVDLCLQEIMSEINLTGGKTKAVFLLEEHKCIGNNTFLLGSSCKGVTLKAFEKFLAETATETVPASVAQHPEEKAISNSSRQVSEAPVKKDLVEGFFLTAIEVANPKMIEKRLREFAGQTGHLSRKTIDAFKGRKQSKQGSPDSEAIERFRKHLV